MQKGLTKGYFYLAYIASLIIILGANLPLYIEAKSKTNLITVSRIDQEGILLLLSSLVVIMLKYCERKKYILMPIIFQTGIMIYHIYLFVSSKNFYMIHIGFILEMFGIVLLIMSMFVRTQVDRQIIHDMSTLKTAKIDENDYEDKIKSKDFVWIIIIVILTSVFLGLKIQINRQEKALAKYNNLYYHVQATEVYNTI